MCFIVVKRNFPFSRAQYLWETATEVHTEKYIKKWMKVRVFPLFSNESFYSPSKEHKRLWGFMSKRPVGVLSLGILILVLAVSATAFAANILVDISEIFSLTLVLFGLWIMVLAGIRAANPEQYGGAAFNTFSGGILITTLGVVWLLYVRALLVEYLLPALLLVVGILVAVAGIRAWRK